VRRAAKANSDVAQQHCTAVQECRATFEKIGNGSGKSDAKKSTTATRAAKSLRGEDDECVLVA
jgi:hypothetical protein